MAGLTFFSLLQKLLVDFRRAKAANVTVTFALATIPVVGFVGAAVDYSRANSVKTALQAAADATALMLSKTATTQTSTQLTTQANNYFKAVFNRPEATGLTVNATYTNSGGSQVEVVANAAVASNFMGLVGVSTMPVGADSIVKWGNTRLRVALVLDNTGSMADDNKMTALISATKSLLNQLKAAATNNGDVYVSIVPFVKDVNVDPSNYKQNWIYWDDAAQSDNSSWDANNGTCNKYGYSNRADCLAAGACVKNGHTSQASQTGCANGGGTWSATWTPSNHKNWNGCVEDRGNPTAPSSNNYDANATAPVASNTATLYPAEQYSYCPDASIMPLSYNWTSMTSLVSSMTPNGATNQTIGLQMGWQSLVGGGPFGTVPAMDPNYKYTQAIILLSDGLNTQDRWYGNGSSTSTQVDSRMSLTCTNAKASNITIYTVQVNTGGDPTSTVLQNCASDSSKFWMLTSASQIVGAFTQIGTALSNLRISQ